MPIRNNAIRTLFGRMPCGSIVEQVTLGHESGIEANIITYGAAVQFLSVPDACGKFDNVVLGHRDLAHYLHRRDFLGATIGRFANRIAGNRFEIDGESFQLNGNEGLNTLHGGKTGFDRCNWTLEALGIDPEPFVLLSHVSPDGDQGFPGELQVRVRYALTDKRELTISFEAKTSRTSVVNLTHHGYFNLRGAANGDILDHHLTIFADTYLPVSSDLIPLSSPSEVSGTPFDFRNPVAIGARINENDPQLEIARGYDHNYCLADTAGNELRLAARLYDPHYGRVMELETDQPGLQFYSGGHLGRDSLLDGETAIQRFGALCLEPQLWPDSPNRKNFPATFLKPSDAYNHTIRFRFHAS